MTRGCSAFASGWTSTREAESAFGAGTAYDAMQDRARYACTVFSTVGPSSSGGVTVEVLTAVDVMDLPDGARVFAFPGHHLLVGIVAVGDLISVSAIDEVRGLGGGDPDQDELVDTQGFVRPQVEGGRLVLRVRPADGLLVPFEQANPTPCCADHA
jgi:hypothetical protein